MTQTLSFTGECLDLEIRKGTTVVLDLELEDDNGELLDLTGYTFPGAIVDPKTGTVLYEFPDAEVVSTTKQRITLTDTITASSPFVVGSQEWAINAVGPTGIVHEFRQGKCLIRKQIVP